MLSIELNVLIFAIINFVILVTVLTKFLYKPVVKMLDERKNAINEALDSAEQARLEVAGTEEHLRAEITKARAEAASIVADARLRGEAARTDIVEAARKEAGEITKAATAEIEAEKNRAIAELKGQIADMALLATEKLLADGLTDAQQRKLMDKYVKEVGQLQ